MTPTERIAQLERENELLRLRLDRLEREVASMRPVVRQVSWRAPC